MQYITTVKGTIVAKTTAPVLDANLRALLEGFRDTIDTILAGGGANGKASLSPEDAYRAELDAMDVTALRKLAVDKWNFAANEVRKVSKSVLIDNLISARFEEDDTDEEPADDEAEEISDEEVEIEEDEADEDDAEEEDEDEEVTVSREDLEAMNLRTLRKFARDNAGMKASDYKDLDTDDLIDKILGEADDSEEEDEEADEDDELEIEDEADDDTEEEPAEDDYYTEAELKAMPLPELKGVAKDSGIKLTRAEAAGKPAQIKAAIIKKLLAA